MLGRLLLSPRNERSRRVIVERDGPNGRTGLRGAEADGLAIEGGSQADEQPLGCKVEVSPPERHELTPPVPGGQGHAPQHNQAVVSHRLSLKEGERLLPAPAFDL